MRDIKFRVWNRKLKQFETCRNGGNCIGFCLSYKGIQEISRKGYCIYEQFIGLKDKNGVEIFEGDILKIVGTNLRWIEGFNFWVEWDEKLSTYSLNRQDTWGKDLHANNQTINYFIAENKGYEVIGNIHQHKELLVSK